MDLQRGPENLPPDQTDEISLDTTLHFAALVNGSNDPILSNDLRGRIISWNSAAARVFGYQAKEMIGQSILRFVPPDGRDEEQKRLKMLKSGMPIHSYETNRLREDGQIIPVSITVFPVMDGTGRVIGASQIVCDISERKQADESRFRLAAIVSSADDAIVSKDLSGIVQSWNHGAHRMFGYSADEIVGKPILLLIPEGLHHEEEEILRKLRVGERVDHYETRRRKKNGEIFDVSVTISPIRDETGRVIGASKIARDISDRKRIERMLIQSEKFAATGRMAATVAHEINNPLESVMNLIYLARQYSEPSGNVHGYLLTAEEELERVSHIARQTLGYYKDTGSPKEVYLHDLIENVLGVYGTKLTAVGITTDLQFNDLQKVTVSPGEMLQVLSNVVANAIDAMRRGGSLRISTRKVGGSSDEGIQIVIRDSGIGIQQEHLERIFEPFFTTKGDLGTGIGLWVALQLVERRGGHISVASSTEKEHSGTTISIFIPFAYPVSRLTSE